MKRNMDHETKTWVYIGLCNLPRGQENTMDTWNGKCNGH